MMKIDFYPHYYGATHSVQTAKNYELTKVIGANQVLLTDIIRIEENRGFSHAKGFKEYLIFRTSSSWAKSLKTGLRPYNENTNVYWGDIFENGRKHLVVVMFSDDRQSLRIDFYRGFYPHTPQVRERILFKYAQ